MPTIDMKKLSKELGKLQERIKKDIDLGVSRSTQRGRSLLVRKTPVDQGQAKAGWRATNNLITNSAPHIGILERGARPHKVSREGIESLTRWVMRVLTIRAKKKQSRQKQARGVAFAIAKKIEKEGQKGTFFIEKTIPKISKILKQEVEEQLKKK